MSDKIFTVHVAKETGHEQVAMTRQDIVDTVSANENTWVFVDSQMVNAQELETIDLNDATENRRKAVGNHKRGSVFRRSLKRLLNGIFGNTVKRRSRFV